MTDFIKAVQAAPNEKIPQMQSGDTVSVHVKIKEGDRERIQEFKGIVIRLRKGGNEASFTVRRMASNGIGVERTFLLAPRALTRWWSNATMSSAGRSCISCATAPARAPASNKNSTRVPGKTLKVFGL